MVVKRFVNILKLGKVNKSENVDMSNEKLCFNHNHNFKKVFNVIFNSLSESVLKNIGES